jgi:hypothetical protein
MKLGDSINTRSLGHEAPCRANPLGQAQEGQPMTIEKLIYATLWLAVSPAIARWFVGTPALGALATRLWCVGIAGIAAWHGLQLLARLAMEADIRAANVMFGRMRRKAEAQRRVL